MKASDAISKKLDGKRIALRERQAEAAALEHDIAALMIEIATWEEALRLVTMSLDDVKQPSGGLTDRSVEIRTAFRKVSDAVLAVVPRENDSRRGPKGAWRVVMPEMLRQYPDGVFGLADVIAAGEIVDAPVHPDTTRSQMANYVKSGYLERVSKGKFRFTMDGRKIFTDLSARPGAAQKPPAKETPAQVDVPEAGAVGRLALVP